MKKIANLSKEVMHEIVRTLNIIQGIDEPPRLKFSYYESRRFDGLPHRKLLQTQRFCRPSKFCTWK